MYKKMGSHQLKEKLQTFSTAGQLQCRHSSAVCDGYPIISVNISAVTMSIKLSPSHQALLGFAGSSVNNNISVCSACGTY